MTIGKLISIDIAISVSLALSTGGNSCEKACMYMRKFWLDVGY